jgi:hypothetical protein
MDLKLVQSAKQFWHISLLCSPCLFTTTGFYSFLLALMSLPPYIQVFAHENWSWTLLFSTWTNGHFTMFPSENILKTVMNFDSNMLFSSFVQVQGAPCQRSLTQLPKKLGQFSFTDMMGKSTYSITSLCLIWSQNWCNDFFSLLLDGWARIVWIPLWVSPGGEA